MAKKKKNNSVLKWAEELNRHTFKKDIIDVETTSLIIRKLSQSDNGISPHTNLLSKRQFRAFPGSPVVKNPCFHCKGYGFQKTVNKGW